MPKSNIIGYTPIPNPGTHKCFACSPINPYGLQMKFWVDGDSVFSHVRVPEHLCGWSKVAHGGVVSAMLDEVMSWAAMYLLKHFVLTKSMHIEFIKPIGIDQEVKVTGRVLEVQKKRDVRMAGMLVDAQGKHCARSEGTFVLLSPKLARRLKIADPAVLKDLEAIIEPDP